MQDTLSTGQQRGSNARACGSCNGMGEIGTEAGLVDCPDCGGVGVLPNPGALVEWRMRDIENLRGLGATPEAQDVRWLCSELRKARAALTEITALSQESESEEARLQVRITAGRALGLFEAEPISA
jgi:hypothetical protein